MLLCRSIGAGAGQKYWLQECSGWSSTFTGRKHLSGLEQMFFEHVVCSVEGGRVSNVCVYSERRVSHMSVQKTVVTDFHLGRGTSDT